MAPVPSGTTRGSGRAQVSPFPSASMLAARSSITLERFSMGDSSNVWHLEAKVGTTSRQVLSLSSLFRLWLRAHAYTCDVVRETAVRGYRLTEGPGALWPGAAAFVHAGTFDSGSRFFVGADFAVCDSETLQRRRSERLSHGGNRFLSDERRRNKSPRSPSGPHTESSGGIAVAKASRAAWEEHLRVG